MTYTYKYSKDFVTGTIATDVILRKEDNACIPVVEGNKDYQQFLQDLKTHGMSIVFCDDCGDGVPNDTMWQYLDNAEQLIQDKYGSDPSLHDKITALREDRYVRAMEAKSPYESMKDAAPIINATTQEIKDKYRHLPMRR